MIRNNCQTFFFFFFFFMRGSVLSVPLIASLQRVWGTFETERRGWDIDILARRQKMRRKFQQKLRHIIVTGRKPACICTDPPLRRYISTARLDIVCICTSSLAGIEPACVITSLALPPLLFFAFPYRRPRVYSSRPWYSLSFQQNRQNQSDQFMSNSAFRDFG